MLQPQRPKSPERTASRTMGNQKCAENNGTKQNPESNQTNTISQRPSRIKSYPYIYLYGSWAEKQKQFC